MRDTVDEAGTKSSATFFDEPLHMDVPLLGDQKEYTHNGAARTQDVV